MDEAALRELAPTATALADAHAIARGTELRARVKSADGSVLGAFYERQRQLALRARHRRRRTAAAHRLYVPPRQRPCKHALGLLIAHLRSRQFEAGEPPENARTKLAKLQGTARKAAAPAKEPKEKGGEALAKAAAKPKAVDAKKKAGGRPFWIRASSGSCARRSSPIPSGSASRSFR